jgi:hypothetical protein
LKGYKNMAEKKKEELKRYVVLPRDNKDYKVGYAKTGNKPVPFGTPIALSLNEVKQLENQKTASKVGTKTPYDVAKEKGVSIDRAVELLEQMGNASKGDDISWLPRYSVEPV